MNGPIIQLLVLAGIAVFLVLKLRGVLGTREGFEKPRTIERAPQRRGGFEVIDGGPDRDIVDYVKEGSQSARALAAMKRADGSFEVGEFIKGARGAYEMILVAFEKGDLASIKPYISKDVYDAFAGVITERAAKGLTIEAAFVGISDAAIDEAEFDEKTNEAEISLHFESEQTYVVRDKGGDIVEGDPNGITRQKDVWTFARTMGTDDPNWLLVATN